MAVIEWATAARPYADGAAFGDAGPYERLDGVARLAVDPAHPANAAIVDLAGPRAAPDGLVHFRADVCLLRPADSARGAGRLLVDVVNRGRKNAPRAPQSRAGRRAVRGDRPRRRLSDAAWLDGRLVRLAVGRASPARVCWGWRRPRRSTDGRPIAGQAVVEFQPNAAQPDHLLANRVHRPYPAADSTTPPPR